MGLLDSSDADIKKTMLYQNAAKGQTRIDEAVASFKKRGGASHLVRDVAQACKQALMDIDRAAKQNPDFGEYAEMRAKAMEVVKALVDKFPQNPDLASTKLKQALEDPSFRY